MSNKQTIYESGLIHVYIDSVRVIGEFVDCVFIDSQNECSIMDDSECVAIPVDSVEGRLIIDSFKKLCSEVLIGTGGQGGSGYAGAVIIPDDFEFSCGDGAGGFIKGDKDESK